MDRGNRRDVEEKRELKHMIFTVLQKFQDQVLRSNVLHRYGMHINEDHFIAEVINPKTGEVLPDGEKGRACIYQYHEAGISAASLSYT